MMAHLIRAKFQSFKIKYYIGWDVSNHKLNVDAQKFKHRDIEDRESLMASEGTNNCAGLFQKAGYNA